MRWSFWYALHTISITSRIPGMFCRPSPPKASNEFRDHLSTASGQLSFMYRHVEFILGNKSAQLASAHKNVPHIWPAMKGALETPSLYDEAIRLLNRAGHKIDDQVFERDWSQKYQPNASVKAAWLAIYQNPAADNLYYQLAESLISLDEKISFYRWRHFTSVHKIIGFKPRTGGSAGVSWLRQVTEHRFFLKSGRCETIYKHAS